MHVAHILGLLAVFSATTAAAPSPKRAHIARTTGEIHARAPFNPYHAAHRFAITAEKKKRASNHGRDMAGVAKEKRKVKKRGTGCAVRASSSVDALIASSTASATEYYVPSSASASASATASGPYVQNAAVNKSDSSWSSPSSSNAQNRDSSSAAATGSSTVRYAVPASSSTSSSSTSTTTPAPAWTSTSTSSTAPATTSASPGTDWKTGGHATYYYQNGNAGACGEYHADSDPIIAINGAGYWSDYGVKSPYCGKWVTIKNPANGKQVQAKVADVCPTCTGSTNSIDLSVGAFEAIGTLDQGQVDIEWAFNN